MHLYSLPKKFHSKHKVCWLLVNQIEDILINTQFDGLRVEIFNGIELKIDEHPLDALVRLGLQEEHDKLIRKQVINGLLGDICYFLQEALNCSAKRRLTVTMALIRKPFLYNLLVLLRIMFDEDFDKDFNGLENYDPTALTNEDKKTLIRHSKHLLVISKSMTEQEIFDYIFNKETDSISNMSDKALHLSTTRNKNNLTGKQNLNYIFATSNNIESIWEYLYRRLPALLLYLNEVIDGIVSYHLDLDNSIIMGRIIKRGEILKLGLQDNKG